MIAKNVTVTAVFVADPSVGEDPGPGYGWYYGGADISPAPAKDKEKDKEDVAVTVAPVVLPFDDVPKNSPYYEAIADVYGRGLMFGTSASLFSPELPLSRGMLTTLLWRLEGKPLVEFRGVFRDVPADEWYSDSVEWAASAGIVEGYGDGRYGVDDDLTWEQLITILYRYAKMKGYITGDVSYAMSGVLDVSEWASEAVCWAMHEGFLKGVSNVKAPCTREGIANTIHLFLDRYNVR
jgi:hypothetical protein